jgi:hypothetical protein
MQDAELDAANRSLAVPLLRNLQMQLRNEVARRIPDFCNIAFASFCANRCHQTTAGRIYGSNPRKYLMELVLLLL